MQKLCKVTIVLACMHLIGCGSWTHTQHSPLESQVVKLDTSINPVSSVREISTTQVLKTQKIQKLYLAEGQRSAPTSCEALNDFQEGEILTRYFAYTRGSKAIVKEHCVSASLIPLPELSFGDCSGSGCRYHDTYRRGPTYFARFLAAFEALSPATDVKIGSFNAQLSSQGSSVGEQFDDRVGLFNLAQHQEVQQQRFRFSLGSQTQCLARLKVFKELQQRERHDTAQSVQITMPARLGIGDLWAEHRRTSQGYELLILERQLAQDRAEGEVLEIELLCINPHEQINPHHAVELSAREINRDTLRVFARPKK